MLRIIFDIDSIPPYRIIIFVTDQKVAQPSFLHKMAISLKNVELNRRLILSFQDDMICPSVVIICSGSWILYLIICASLSLLTSCIAPFGRPSTSVEFLHSLIPPHYACCCPRHNTLWRSLLMLVLSHSDPHYLNRYIVGCGCHERSNPCRSSQGYMTWCGCHEILIALWYTEEVFCPDRKSLKATEIFYLDDKRNAQR